MKIVICDDVKDDALAAANCLTTYFQQHQLPMPQLITVSDGAALHKIEQIDLLFLDIELKNESGIELAAQINLSSPQTIVVFISNYPYHVTDAYNVNAAQFFVKPLQYNIFQREFSRILERYQAIQDTFTRKVGHNEVIFRKADIVYIESYKRILIVHTLDGKSQQYYGKISDEEQFFAGTCIIRCHRSYLINLAHTINISRTGITLQYANGSTQTIAVGETWYDTLRTKFLHYISKQ